MSRSFLSLLAFVVIGIVTVIGGCGGTRDVPARAPQISVTTDAFDVAPGDEVLMCTVTDQVLDADFDVETVHSYQMKGGHHAALFYTTDPLTPGPTHKCANEETMNWQLVGAGAEGQEVGLVLPPGIALRIPAGARIVVESHYVNASNAPKRVQDRVTADAFADPSLIKGWAGVFQVTDFAMAIPPHTTETRTIECSIAADMDAIDLNGHAHQWAQRVEVTLARAGSTQFTSLYDQQWEPDFQFHPPTDVYPPGAPLRLHRDDRVRVTCTWNNTTDRTLRFPSEMCIATMHYLPGRGYVKCGTAIATSDH